MIIDLFGLYCDYSVQNSSLCHGFIHYHLFSFENIIFYKIVKGQVAPDKFEGINLYYLYG